MREKCRKEDQPIEKSSKSKSSVGACRRKQPSLSALAVRLQ